MQNKVFLQTGEEKKLPTNSILEIGLSWEMFGEKIDLDLTAVSLTETGQIVEAIYFKKTSSEDSSIIHSGDERTGQKEGYDEKITIYSKKLNSSTKIIAFLINSSSGQTFQKIETAELSIFTPQEYLVSINCSCSGDAKSLLSSILYRNNQCEWVLKSINESGSQNNFVECLPMITKNISFLIDEDTLKESESWNILTGKSFDLKKGDEIDLAHCLKDIAIGLGWETYCDIDSSIVTLDDNLKLVEYIYYGHKQSADGSINHQGDNTTGQGQGDDENITINLENISKNVSYLGCSINVFSGGKTFKDVTEAFCRLIDWNSKKEFCKYNLNEFGNSKCCLMCYLKRDGKGWKIKGLGKFLPQFYVDQIVLEIKNDVEGKNEQKQQTSNNTSGGCCKVF